MMFLMVVTLTSMLLAAVMSVIAWRIAGDDRRRSDARIAALSAEIHEAAPERVAIVAEADAPRRADHAGPRWDEDLEIRPAGRSANAAGRVLTQPPQSRVHNDAAHTDLFVTPSPGARPFVVLAGAALVLGAVVAVAIVGGRASGAPMWRPALAGPTPREGPAPAAQPLELVALGHERDGDRLTVRGVVHNPASGEGMDRLTAVVLMFTPDGGFIASGRAAVASPALRPGGESAFVVTVPGAGGVGRYRVSFRTDERVVPHLDRRHERS